VEEVRFRWSAGDRKYKYNFYRYIVLFPITAEGGESR
jgi:hypothetical protein